MSAFPEIPYDRDAAIWRIREDEPAYFIVEQYLARFHPRERARQYIERERAAAYEQHVYTTLQAFGEEVARNDATETQIGLMTPDDIVLMLRNQLKCEVTPNHIIRALSRAMLLYHIDTQFIDTQDAINVPIINIVWQSSTREYLLPATTPTSVNEITDLILFRSYSTITQALRTMPHLDSRVSTSRTISYASALYFIAMRAIRIEKIMYIIKFCTHQGVCKMYKMLARGLSQNVLVCDHILTLHDAIPHGYWRSILCTVLDIYCGYDAHVDGVKYSNARVACLFARDMVLITARTQCDIDMTIVTRSLDNIAKMVTESRDVDLSRNKPFRHRLMITLRPAILSVVCAETGTRHEMHCVSKTQFAQSPV